MPCFTFKYLNPLKLILYYFFFKEELSRLQVGESLAVVSKQAEVNTKALLGEKTVLLFLITLE